MNIDRLIARAKAGDDKTGLDTLYYVAELATRLDISLKNLSEASLRDEQGGWIGNRNQLNSLVLQSLTKQDAVHAVAALVKSDTPQDLPLFSPADLRTLEASLETERRQLATQESFLARNVAEAGEHARQLGELARRRAQLRGDIAVLKRDLNSRRSFSFWHDAVAHAEMLCPSWKFLGVSQTGTALSFRWLSSYPVRIRRLLYPEFAPVATGHWMVKVHAESGETQVLNVPVVLASTRGILLGADGKINEIYRHCSHPNISSKGIWCWGSQAHLYEQFQESLISGKPNFSLVLRLLSSGLPVANEGEGGPFWQYGNDGLPGPLATYPAPKLTPEAVVQIEAIAPHAADPMYTPTQQAEPAGAEPAPTELITAAARDGFDGDGYDRDGYDRGGYNRDGYDRDGFARGGYNRDGYDREGYDRAGYDRDGYDADGFDRDGFDRDGYSRGGYNRDGYDRDGYNRDGVDREGFDLNGFDRDGYDIISYDRDGYNRDGFNRDGYNEAGFDRDGYDADGFDRDGFDRDGFDRDDYDRDGYNREGFDRDGVERPLL